MTCLALYATKRAKSKAAEIHGDDLGVNVNAITVPAGNSKIDRNANLWKNFTLMLICEVASGCGPQKRDER